MADLVIDWTACSIVEVVPGKVGGAPVIKGTRLPVSSITDNYDSGVEPEEIAEMFRVSIDVVDQVLRFRQELLGDPSESNGAEAEPDEAQPQGPDTSGNPPGQET